MHLDLITTSFLPVEIPGLAECSTDDDCPAGKSCTSYFFCEL